MNDAYVDAYTVMFEALQGINTKRRHTHTHYMNRNKFSLEGNGQTTYQTSRQSALGLHTKTH
jgi:hypothetical protein